MPQVFIVCPSPKQSALAHIRHNPTTNGSYRGIMRRIFLSPFLTLALFITVFASTVTAQNDPSAPVRRCGVAPFSTCGFVNPETQEFVIEAEFENVFPFYGDFAAVQINGKWGYINRAGEITVEPQFETVGPMQYGLAAVTLNNRPQLIDQTGQHITTPPFMSAVPISNDTVLIELALNDFSFEPDPLLPGLRPQHFYPSWCCTAHHGSFRLLDLEAGDVSEQIYDNIEVHPHSTNGTVWLRHVRNQRSDVEGATGLANEDGSWAIAPRYAMIRDIGNGRVLAITPDRRSISVYDSEGSLLFSSPLYKSLRPFGDDHFLAYPQSQEFPEPTVILNLDGSRYNDVVYQNIDRIFGPSKTVVFDGTTWWAMGQDGLLIPRDHDAHRSSEIARRQAEREMPPTLACLGGQTERFSEQSLARLASNSMAFNRFAPDLSAFFWFSISGILGLAYLTSKGQQANWKPFAKYGLISLALLTSISVVIFPRSLPVDVYEATSRGWGIRMTGGGEVLVPAVHSVVLCYRNGVAWVPDLDTQQWCPIAPDGARHTERPCLDHYPYLGSGSLDMGGPEPFYSDYFTDEIIHQQRSLLHLEDSRHPSPQRVFNHSPQIVF